MVFAIFSMFLLGFYDYKYISYVLMFSAFILVSLFINHVIYENYVLHNVLIVTILAVNYFTIFIYNCSTSRLQKVSEFFYGLFAILAIFRSNNLVEMVIYAELSVLMSLVLVMQSKKDKNISLELNKYFLIHGASGLFLLIGSLHFLLAGDIISMPFMAQAFLLLGFGIKAGFPIFNTWMHSIYSNVFPSGTLPLSIFTTKIGIVGLYTFFPGYSLLIYVGLFIAVVQLIFALFEDNIIKSYVHILNNQMGCMMIGIGIGTEDALNGVLALLITQICYETFVFMIMGIIVSESGKNNFSDFKGLVINSPLMQIFVVAIIFVSGMPYFAGFFGKALFLHGIKYYSVFLYYLIKLIFLGVFMVTAIRAIYMIDFNSNNNNFYMNDQSKIKLSMPNNVIIALICQFFICLVIGIFGFPLPYDNSYEVNSIYNFIEQLFLIVIAIGIFCILFKSNIYFYVIDLFKKNNIKLLSYQKLIFDYFSSSSIEVKNNRFVIFRNINFKFLKVFGNVIFWFLFLAVCALILYLA